MDKLDIIVLAGQSNAAGSGRGEVTHPYVRDERILMMTDDSNPREEKDGDRGYLKLDLPANNFISVAEEPEDWTGYHLEFQFENVNENQYCHFSILKTYRHTIAAMEQLGFTFE